MKRTFAHRSSCCESLGKVADKAHEIGKAETKRYYAERMAHGSVLVMDKKTGREIVVTFGGGEPIAGIPAS